MTASVQPEGMATVVDEKRLIKCVIWDLDHTIWRGTLAEDRQVTVRPEAVQAIQGLDARGILQSIASRNDRADALRTLHEVRLAPYFLHPQISWGAKSAAVAAVAERLNIAFANVAFIDDDPVERAEVQYQHADVLCLDAVCVDALLTLPRFMPKRVTPEAANRRALYLANAARQEAEEEFVGPREEFLASLGMVCTIASARPDDLARAEELTIRTNQLNTSGRTYSYDELAALACSPRHKLLMAALQDRFGDYGTIGLTLLACEPQEWTIQLMLVSCRVMSRGVATAMLQVLMRQADACNVRLLAEFTPTPLNRMMYLFYRSMGLRPIADRAVPDRPTTQILMADRSERPAFPTCLQVSGSFD